jgi:hypothetical protein
MIRLLDILMETRIFELAYNRKTAVNKVRDISLNTSMELLKILMYKDSRNQNHWRAKFDGWMASIKRYSKGTLKERDLFHLLWVEPLGDLDQLEDLISMVESDYYSPSYHIDYSNLPSLHKQMKSIFASISRDISINKHININNYI